MPDTSGGNTSVSIHGIGSLIGAVGRALRGGSSWSTGGQTGTGNPMDPNYIGPTPQIRPYGGFGAGPYTGGKVPAGSTVTYSNVGAYEPYRGSPNTHNKKVRRKTRTAKKWVDQRPVWEKMLDWATNPASWGKGQTLDGNKPMREQPPEVQAQFKEYMTTQGLYAGVDAIMGMGSSKVRANVPKLKAPPTMRTYSKGATMMDPIDVPPMPTAKEPRLAAVYPGYVPRASAVSMPGIEEVKVSAQRVGHISAPLSDDRYAMADAVAPLEEVEVSAKYIVGPVGGDTWMEHYYGTGRNTANKVSAGPGRADAARRPAGSTGTATKPATGTATARRASRVALPSLGSIVISPDTLVREMLRQLTKRSSRTGQSRQRLGAALVSPGQAPVSGRAPAREPFLNPFAPGYRRGTTTDECSCEKKPSKPRKSRTVCYKGTYTESARGLSKRKREQIPC